MDSENLESVKESVKDIKKEADKILSMATKEYIKSTSEKLEDNKVTFYGIFKNDDNTEATFRTDTTVKNLLDLDIMEVTKLLSAFGNYERFKILLLLLDKGRTVNEIVEELDFPTTGKAYHHLNALMSAGLLLKTETGRYRFKARYIQGIMAMLVGCHSYISKSRDEFITVDNL